MALCCATANAAEPPTTLDPVVVTGSRVERPSAQLPFSISAVDAQALQDAGPGINLSEALARVPGLQISNRNNYAQDLQISSRGYGTRSSFGVRGLRLYTDGIPASAPDGQGQVTHFNLATAERIEVLRGPFSALYGNSSGGVIALYSRDAERDAVSGSIEGGSFGLRLTRVDGEMRWGQHWNGIGEISQFSIDGFRPHSAARRTLGFARIGYDYDGRRVNLTASYLNQPAQDPLGLTRAQFDQNPRQTAPQATTFDTRKNADQTQLGLSWRESLGEGALKDLTVSSYAGQRNITQWQAIPVATQANPLHPGGVIDLERLYYGTDARLRAQWGTLELIGGLNAEWQDEHRRGYENFIGPQLGVTGALRRDENNVANNFDQYLQAEWHFAPQWRASAGMRHGNLHFRSQDQFLSNGDDSGSRNFSYTNPVAGLLFQPWSIVSFYASIGRGYESPTFNELANRPDGTSGLNTNLQAQNSLQYEVGSKLRINHFSLDAALFRADTEHEIVTQTNSGGRSAFGNAGRTRREGIELSTAWREKFWHALASVSTLDARYRDAFLTCAGVPCATPTLTIPAGNHLPATSSLFGYTELGAFVLPQTELALEWRGRSRFAVNDANSDYAAGHGLLAARAEQHVNWSWTQLTLSARVDNLLDKDHAASVIVNEANARYFEPGPPLSFMLALKAEFASK